MPTSRLMKLSDVESLAVMSTLSSTVTAEARNQYRQGISAIIEMIAGPTGSQ